MDEFGPVLKSDAPDGLGPGPAPNAVQGLEYEDPKLTMDAAVAALVRGLRRHRRR